MPTYYVTRSPNLLTTHFFRQPNSSNSFQVVDLIMFCQKTNQNTMKVTEDVVKMYTPTRKSSHFGVYSS